MKILRYFDGHIVINILGMLIRIKYARKINCPEVKDLGVTKIKREERVIVSLTSFPERIETVIKTIKTLLTQSMKPDEVILWLAKEQFPNMEEDLPANLLKLREYGLTIDWYEDIRSYKKIIPTLKKYPNDVIITVDDDIYYSEDTIETLYKSYIKNPKEIPAHRCDWIFLKDGKINWEKTRVLYKDLHRDVASFHNRLTGYGAVLYPPHCLHSDVLREDLIKQLLPTHDDVWLWAMACLNGTKTRLVKGYSESINYVEDSQQYGLCKINKKGVGTSLEEAYVRITEKYPRLLEILKEVD